jgi:hypothetical protein
MGIGSPCMRKTNRCSGRRGEADARPDPVRHVQETVRILPRRPATLAPDQNRAARLLGYRPLRPDNPLRLISGR